MAGKILVTGGMGYIGSHTVVELQQSGYQVVILDNLSNSEQGILDLITRVAGVKPEFVQLDMQNRERLEGFFREHHDLEGVIHFAAYKAVGESVENPLMYYRNNVGSLVNLLDCMTDSPAAKNLVFSSSCTVYGQPDTLPVSEDAPVKPAMSPYGNTKQISEEIIEDTCQANGGLEAISLRYFNPIGAHESGLLGELPLGVPNNLVPFITQTAIGKRAQLTVFGKDYDTPDGTCIRDYIHVSDLARAHVVALERLLAKQHQKSHEIFNLGTGTGYSVLEAVNTFEQTTGVKLNWKFSDRRPGDVEKVWADTGTANKVLGWKAERGLKEMMSTAWQWEVNLNDGLMD